MTDYEEYSQSLKRNIVPPLNWAWVKKVLERNGWSYQVGNEGDIARVWENGIYHFEATGNRDSVLCVRGIRRGKLELDDFMLVSSLCSRWNTEHYWPKTYVRVTDNRELSVHTELPISYHAGLADPQLDRHLHRALGSSEGFLEKLGEKFPQFDGGTPDEEAQLALPLVGLSRTYPKKR